jgi:predicted nucleotidyltransferase component of viral defense system
MNSAVKTMLNQRSPSTKEEVKNALKEIIQEIVLLALSRAKFFEHAAFYGGTALRLFYGLDRFSEDIDFSLLHQNPTFDLEKYCTFVKDELLLYGFKATVEKKAKKNVRQVDSAFVKANTLWHMIHVADRKFTRTGIHSNELLKVKFEVDIRPPAAAGYEVQFLYQPLPFSVKLYDPPSLFAGKMHAFLCRNIRGARVKGRDVYDVVWLTARDVPINRVHLENRMKQSGHLRESENISEQELRTKIRETAASMDYDAARQDVRIFLPDPRATDVWSVEFMDDVVKRIRFV